MKKLSIILSIMLVLVGCSNRNEDYGAGFRSGLAKPNIQSTNHKKPYYRYYVPPHVGIKKSDRTSTLFSIEGQQVLMALSVDKIVSTKFNYKLNENTINLEKPVFSEEASYIDIRDKSHMMSIRIYKLKNEQFAVYLNNDQINLTAIVPKPNLKITVDTMVSILKTVIVDSEEVVRAYSNKEISTYDSTYSEFFEQTPPETGTIKDMYEQLNPNKN